MTPTSVFMLVVHETVAFCIPEGGLATQKTKVRKIELVPESVPGINVAVIPPRLALILVAVVAVMATIIIPARLAPLPTRHAGVVTSVVFPITPDEIAVSQLTPGWDTPNETV